MREAQRAAWRGLAVALSAEALFAAFLVYAGLRVSERGLDAPGRALAAAAFAAVLAGALLYLVPAWHAARRAARVPRGARTFPNAPRS